MHFNLEKLLGDLKRLRPTGRAVAAFDADGTLWDTDLGEALFHYQIKHKLVPLPADAWGHYEEMKEKVSRRAAYLWLAQINKGVPIATVNEWAKKAVAEMEPIPVFAEQKRIISELHALKVDCYIVTASVQWAVAPAAHLFGIPERNVLGIETEVVDGIVTDKQKGVITFREGKLEALLAATGGVKPYFSAGNTEGDQFLIEGSTALRLIVAAAKPGTENFKTERKMVAMGRERGWYVQDHFSGT